MHFQNRLTLIIIAKGIDSFVLAIAEQLILQGRLPFCVC